MPIENLWVKVVRNAPDILISVYVVERQSASAPAHRARAGTYTYVYVLYIHHSWGGCLWFE